VSLSTIAISILIIKKKFIYFVCKNILQTSSLLIEKRFSLLVSLLWSIYRVKKI